MTWLTKFFQFREKSDGDIVKPFLDHMEDLRWTLIKMGITLVTAMIISFFFVKDLMHIIQQPMIKAAPELQGLIVTRTIIEPFMVSIMLAFFAGFALALPFLSYFGLSFILPALTRQEKKFLFPGIAGSFILFAAGVLVSYYWILPETLRFFYDYSLKMGVKILWEWKDYISFCAWLTIGFGLLCQLPVVMIALAFLGIVNFRFLNSTRPYAVTIILILSAIVAPTPDPVTFISLGLPIIVLYEICIWLVWLIDRRKKQKAEELPDPTSD
jgi:sec-independent protein translocase protein TatC